MNIGSFNRLMYDECSREKRLGERTSPFIHQTYAGKYENCNKPIHDKFYKRGDIALVDQESELQGRNRPSSHCDQYKYNPNCTKSKLCVSTFDKSVPVVLAPEIKPPVRNNLKPITNSGLRKLGPVKCNCGKKH